MRQIVFTSAAVSAVAAFSFSLTTPVSAQPLKIVAPITDSNRQIVETQAGGPVFGLDLSSDCMGFFGEQASVEVEMEPGQNLAVFVAGDSDVTLALQTPSDQFICNDDALGTRNAAVELTADEAGVYQIWPGSFSSELFPTVKVGITDRFPAHVISDQANGFDLEFAAIFGLSVDTETELVLEPVLPDPSAPDSELPEFDVPPFMSPSQPDTMIQLAFSANEPLSTININCAGIGALTSPTSITSAYAEERELVFFGASLSDLTLLVIAPDGTVACSDDFAGSNPLVSFSTIQAGVYEAYLGVYSGDVVEGSLYAGPAPSTGTSDLSQDFRYGFETAIGSLDTDTFGSGLLLPDDTFTSGLTLQPLAFLTPENGTIDIDNRGVEIDSMLVTSGSAELQALDGFCSGTSAQAATIALAFKEELWYQNVIIEATSNTDAVMAIVDADGTVSCNDDGPNGMNPQLTITPQGYEPYKVWIGQWSGSSEPFTTRFSVQTNAVEYEDAPDFDANPLFGEYIINLDERTVIRFASNMETSLAPISGSGLDCPGVVNTAPSIDLTLDETTVGGASFDAGDTLLLRGPNETWICDSDGSLSFDTLLPGDYRVWTGPDSTGLSVSPN